MRAMKTLLTVCAWTKQVKVDGRWLSFDEYLSEYLGFNITHGMSEDTANQMLQELKIKIK